MDLKTVRGVIALVLVLSLAGFARQFLQILLFVLSIVETEKRFHQKLVMTVLKMMRAATQHALET